MSHSYEQIDELLALLKSLQAEHGAMTPGELEGYVTALIVCPETIPLFEWLPPVWGDEGAAPFGGLWKAEELCPILGDGVIRRRREFWFRRSAYRL